LASSTTRPPARWTTTCLRDNYIDRIYDTYIDEEELQACDHTIWRSRTLEPRGYSSREFIWEMGKWLSRGQRQEARLADPDRL
jgi:deoxyhypusine synthase